MTATRWPRFVLGAILGCVGIIAWCVHDISKTWEASLRLPEENT
jgi:hypothetical protein